MWGWIVTIAFAALALAGWLCAFHIHFQDERHIRERDNARSQRDRLNERNAELSDALERGVDKMYAAYRQMIEEVEQERDALRLKLAEALSPARTVPIKVVDALVGEAKPKRASRAKRNGNVQE